MVDAVDVPVNADFEGGFAVDPEQINVNVNLAVATGVADDSGTGIVLTGRSEGFVVGRPDIDETVQRLRAYAQADCLYAPRIGGQSPVGRAPSVAVPAPP